MYKKHSDIHRQKWYLSNNYTSRRQDWDLTHKTTPHEMQFGKEHSSRQKYYACIFKK